MNTGKIPQGMTAVTPYLTVKDIDAAITFYEKAFGFEKKFTMPGPDGKTAHAEMTHGGHTLMFGTESEMCGTVAPPQTGKTSFGLYLYVESVDKFFENAVQNGATKKEEPHDMFWGDRVCALVDPFGHHWSFGTFVREVKPEELQQAMLEQFKEKAHA